jgi:hypothetical protein
LPWFIKVWELCSYEYLDGDEYRKILTGHTIDVEDSYVMPRPEEVLEAYLKVVDDLTINEENRLKTKVEVLEEKIAEIA